MVAIDISASGKDYVIHTVSARLILTYLYSSLYATSLQKKIVLPL